MLCKHLGAAKEGPAETALPESAELEQHLPDTAGEKHPKMYDQSDKTFPRTWPLKINATIIKNIEHQSNKIYFIMKVYTICQNLVSFLSLKGKSEFSDSII